MERETSLGEAREVAEAGGSGSDHLRNVLLCSGPDGATLWVVNLDVDGSDAEKLERVHVVFLSQVTRMKD